MWLSRLFMNSETVGFGHHAVLLLECSKDGAQKPTLSFLLLLTDTVVGRKPKSARRRDNMVVGGSHQGLGEAEREYRKHVRKMIGYHLPPHFAEAVQSCQASG